MRWSMTIAKIRGTVVRVHVTFLLLLVWVGGLYGAQGGVPAALDGILFICLVFLCVVLHEFGHVAAAARYGVKTPDITLFPIGGVASLERMPEEPLREIFVALAGPAVNVVIALALFLVLGATFDLSQMAQIEEAQMSMVGRLAAVNVLLVLFNLIPAFPTDGGRVFRALLALRMSRVKATRWAAATGQAFAGLFVVLGLFGNPLLILIGIFIFLAGGAENREVAQRAVSAGMKARDAMIVRFESLGPASTAQDAARLLLLTTQQEFPVLSEERKLLGMVTRDRLIKAMKDRGEDAPVRDFMIRETPHASPDTDLDEVMDMIRSSDSRTAAVFDGKERFVGYVSGENLTELFMLYEARGDTEPLRAQRPLEA